MNETWDLPATIFESANILATAGSTSMMNPCFSRIFDPLSWSLELMNSLNPSVSMELPIRDYQIYPNIGLLSNSYWEFYRESYEEDNQHLCSCQADTAIYYRFWGQLLAVLFTQTHLLNKEPIWVILRKDLILLLPFYPQLKSLK